MDHGDISQQLQLKMDLKCKDFRHFLENIAPELDERFPLIDHAEFAHGTVRTVVELNSNDEKSEFSSFKVLLFEL